jgi:hypothetical protein
MLLALLVEFAMAPRALSAPALTAATCGSWHGLGSAVLVSQWLCAGSRSGA